MPTTCWRDDESPDGTSWEDWLQTNRIELNTMTTPQFIAWLDARMAAHAEKNGGGKLIPPPDVLEADLAARIEQRTRTAITERILREAGLDDQVKAAVAAIDTPSATTLVKGIKRLFETAPERDWRSLIEAVATERTNNKGGS